VTPDSDSRLQLTLTKSPPARAAAGSKKAGGAKVKPSGPQPPAAAAPKPDLHNGDVVDPFAR
jgi:hypothetical protein